MGCGKVSKVDPVGEKPARNESNVIVAQNNDQIIIVLPPSIPMSNSADDDDNFPRFTKREGIEQECDVGRFEEPLIPETVTRKIMDEQEIEDELDRKENPAFMTQKGFKEKEEFDFLRKIENKNQNLTNDIKKILEKLKPKESYFKAQAGAEKFKDEDFVINSTMLPDYHMLQDVNTERLTEKEKDFVLFDNIHYNNTNQGMIGDCYFISSLAAMAQHPDLVKKIFTDYDIDQACFEVRVFFNGCFNKIVLDDYLPYTKYGSLAFSKSPSKRFWGVLLEKAWIKVNRSMKNISGGLSEESFIFMTGAPSDYHSIKKQVRENPKLSEAFWSKLNQAHINKYPVVAASEITPENKSITQNMSYAVLKAVEINKDGKNVKLVNLWKAWGTHCWQGNWSAESNLWTPELKKQVGFVEEDDGSFYMEFSEFLQNYRSISVCCLKDNYVINSMKSSSPKDKFCYFRVRVTQRSQGHVILTQLEKRMTREIFGKDKYSYLVLVMLKIMDNGVLRYIQSARSYRPKFSFTDNDYLEEGNYLFMALGEWEIPGLELFTLYTYMDNSPEIEECECDENWVVPEMMKSYFVQNCQKTSLSKDGCPNAFYYFALIQPMAGYLSGIYLKNKEEDVIVEFTIKIISFTGSLVGEHEGKKDLSIILKPGEDSVIFAKNPKPLWSGQYTITHSLKDMNGNKIEKKEKKVENIYNIVGRKPEDMKLDELIKMADQYGKKKKFTYDDDKVGYKLWYFQNGYHYLLVFNDSDKALKVSFDFKERTNCEMVNASGDSKWDIEVKPKGKEIRWFKTIDNQKSSIPGLFNFKIN